MTLIYLDLLSLNSILYLLDKSKKIVYNISTVKGRTQKGRGK